MCCVVYLAKVYHELSREHVVVIRSFQDNETELFFEKGIVPVRKGWTSVKAVAQRKLDMIHYAKDLKDLRSPSANGLESLK